MNEKETDKLCYDILADLHPALVRALDGSLKAGSTAERIAGHLRHTYLPSTTIDLAIGAAHYLESQDAKSK